MHDSHRLASVVDRILDRLAHQPLGALARHRLDADRRSLRKADFLDAHVVDQKLHELPRAFGLRRPFDSGVDILRVLAKNHHVHFLGRLDRAGHAGEILDRPQADIQVELLAQRDIERPDASAHGSRQRPFDRHDVILEDRHRLVGQPHVGAVDLGRLFAGVDLHPVDFSFSRVGLGHRRVDHLDHHRCDVDPGAVAFDVGNDRLIRNVEAVVLVDGDFLASGGNLHVLIRGHDFSSVLSDARVGASDYP